MATSLKKRFSVPEIEALYTAANSAIWHSHTYAHTRAIRKPREEDYVATLVSDAIPLLASRWTSLLSPKGIKLRIAGVFCHGQPQVSFGSPPRRVELADLLIVHRHFRRRSTVSRALLVQAKTSIDPSHRLSSGDPQLELFTTWPPFRFVSGGLSSHIRNLDERGKGSRYALVLDAQKYPEDIEWPDQCPWATCGAGQELFAERSLAKTLVNMLLATDGRDVRLSRPADDWSKTIKELLEVTGAKTYKRRNIRRSDTPRMAGNVNFLLRLYDSDVAAFRDMGRRKSAVDAFFGRAQVDIDNVPPDIPGQLQEVAAEDPGEGISTLIIETRDLEQ